MPWVYRDRTHAGEVLATHLTADAAPEPVTVLALPRGGVPVAFRWPGPSMPRSTSWR